MTMAQTLTAAQAGTRYQSVGNVSVGATVDTTFDSIGTITLDQDATAILGFYVSAAGAGVETTVEAHAGQCRFNIGSFRSGVYNAPPVYGEQPGTNSGARVESARFYPRAITGLEVHGSLGATTVSCDYTLHLPDSTNVISAVFSVLIWRGPPNPVAMKEVQDAARLEDYLPNINGDSEANAAVTTTGAAITALELTGDYNTLVGFETGYSLDTVGVAGVESVGFYSCVSTLSHFSTQEVPMPARTAVLGTPVGAPVGATQRFPAWIPTLGAKGTATVTPTVTLNATVDTTAFFAGVVWQ